MSREPETRRSPSAIRRDIARTREHLDGLMQALETRLAPGELLEDAWETIREHAGPEPGGRA